MNDEDTMATITIVLRRNGRIEVRPRVAPDVHAQVVRTLLIGMLEVTKAGELSRYEVTDKEPAA